jgi:hypothetical protein
VPVTYSENNKGLNNKIKKKIVHILFSLWDVMGHLKIDISTMRPAITLHCPLFKVMLLKIGNPPNPLMCCPLKNTKKA